MGGCCPKLYAGLSKRRSSYYENHSSTGGPHTGASSTRYVSVLQHEGCDTGHVIRPDHIRVNNVKRAPGVDAITDSHTGRAKGNADFCSVCCRVPCCCPCPGPDARVSISDPRLNVEAGKRVILCTVHLNMRRKNKPTSAPKCNVLKPDHASNDKVECKEQESLERNTKVYHIFYYAEKTGRRTLQISFDGLNVKIERGSPTIGIDVLPSSPCSLKLQNIKGDQNTRSVYYYPSGEVEFYVVPYDKFGNVYDRGNLKMLLKEADSIRLISSKVVNSKGLYSVRAQCLKVGQTKCTISFQGITTPLVFSFEVHQVPVSSQPSRINKDLVDEYARSQSRLSTTRRGYCANNSSTVGLHTGACSSSVLRHEGCHAGYVIGPDQTRLKNINRALGVEAITNTDIGRAKENDDFCSDCCRVPCCCPCPGPDARVSISDPTLNVEAGKRVILCTVHLNMRRKNKPTSAPKCNVLKPDKVECKEQESPGPGIKVYHIIYCAEKTGRRTLQLSFDGLSVNIERGSPIIGIDVLPSSPCGLKLQSIEGDQNTESVYYPSGQVEFYVVPCDKFGNICDQRNLKMHLKEDDSIKLISSEVVGNEGLYSVRAQCLKVGQTKCTISFQGITTPLVFSFEVRDVPVSSKHSRINKEGLEDGYEGSQSKLYKRRRRYCANHSSTGGPHTRACSSSVLRLEGCDAGYVIGPDHTHLNNINRALGVEAITDSDIGRAEENDELCTDCCRAPCSCCPCCRNENLKKFKPKHACAKEEFRVDEEESTLDIDLHRLRHEDEVRKVENLLDFLLEARHYRRLADESDKKRLYWKNRATSAYESGLRHEAKICSDTKKRFGARMNKSNRRACDAIFAFYNDNRSQSEIDLHGLYVSDEGKLKDLKKQLVKQMGECGASEAIARIRESSDEAIRKLQERLNTFDRDKAINDETPWLEIIVGAGKHSRDNRQKIRPKVEKFLRNRQDLPAYQLLRKGSLLITFREYSGQQPCSGHFYCKRCDHSWRSILSWVGKYQCCYRCFEESNLKEKCYPMKLEKRREGSMKKSTSEVTHLPKLCQRCCELGRCCSNA